MLKSDGRFRYAIKGPRATSGQLYRKSDNMKKTVFAEDEDVLVEHFFDTRDFGAIIVQQSGVVAGIDERADNAILDSFVAVVKWSFLYIPGAAVIHLVMMGLALLLWYGDLSAGLMLGGLGAAAVATFMAMLGIGKLSDLKYLRVVGGIFAVSALLAILYSILIVFVPGDYFGFFSKVTLPLSLLAGYLIKRNTDEQSVTEIVEGETRG